MHKIKILIAILIAIGLSCTASLNAAQPPLCRYSKASSFDFDGDGCFDEYEIEPGVISVTFGRNNENIRFQARNNANPQHDYNTKLGKWKARDIDGDGKIDFEHDPNVGHRRMHCWISNFSRDRQGRLVGGENDGFKLYDSKQDYPCEKSSN